MASIRANVEGGELGWTQNKDFGSNQAFLAPSKLISLQRQSNGFGFTLRHFVVYPPELIKKSSESGVNGLDHHGENADRQKTEPMDTVFVRQVAPSGPADRAGLSTGDQIVSVNGHPVMGKSYSQVIELILSSQELLELGIIPKEDCVLQMVTPGLSVPPKISLSTHELNQPPPPIKPKPAYRRRSSGENPGRVMSSVTISPAKSFHLNMADKPSNGDTPNPAVTLRRGSVDRTAMENRSFVITSENVDYNSNLKSRSSSALESSSGNTPRMDGSYFMAATDSMGRPLALRFEKGSKVGNTLTVLEDSWTKTRSHSLPVTELQGFEERSRTSSTLSDVGKVRTAKVTDAYSVSADRSAVSIPPFMLSSPRTVASDSPSTTYMNTNTDVGSRQPVATDPGFQKTRLSHEETASYLIRTLASRMSKDRQGSLKSSTMGTTLSESRDVYSQQQSSYNGQWVGSESNAENYKESDSPHPAKVPRQGDNHIKPVGFSSQVSMFPNKQSFEEVTFSPSPVSTASESDASLPNKQGSPKPRRVSYLMATSRGNASPSDQKIWATAPQTKKPTKSSVFEALSTMLPPVMVHVSSGMELCEDVGIEEGMDIHPDEQEDEVFSGSTEGKVTSESTVQRTGRRISYVMATSPPTSVKYEMTLEETKEEEETKEQGDAVPGMLEVYKEGLLWRKLAVVDGGKRSSARSWKPVFVVLRGHILYLHKDKGSAHQEDNSDEQPISIKSSIVDIAHDYTKRKNVFRLTTFNGSEFLFQTEDHDSMMSWIAAIQANNNPDEDENGVSSQSLIIRRMKTVEHETSGSSTVSSGHKLSPPVNTKISGIPGISNIKKSLSFKNITTGQKGESGKSHSNKSLKKRKKLQHPNSYPSGHSIGVPLELCPSSKNNKMIPLIVEHCCDVVERKGLETVGVYRVPGNSAAVTALQEELNSRGIENVCLDEEKWNDVNNITSLVKLFLRKLPEGLVTADLYDAFIESNKKEDASERMWSIRSVLQELPDHNYETLKFLMNHLKTVSDNCDKNKMEVRNLAIVFGPTVIRTGDDSMIAMVKDMSDQCRIVETLITEYEWFFEDVEGDGCSIKSVPSSLECTQDQILSQNVLSSLGQLAVNFGDDGTYKPKSSGISLHIPKFRSGKSSKSDSGQGSSSDGPLSDSQGSESSPPTERAPMLRSVSGEGSRSNSPTLERSSKFGAKRVTETSSSAVHVVIDSSDAEFRSKGAGSLKAYSYSHPPPPSYRRVNQQKRPTSPGTPDQPFLPLEVSFSLGTQELEVKKSPDEPPSDTDNPLKPSFSSFSEETRRRLLRLNLQKKAAEKRRQSEGEREASSPLVEKNDEVIRDGGRDFHRKLSDQENVETSSSSTSRSSSAHSSKNPSLDSLPVAPQTEKLPGGPAHGEPSRVSGSFKTSDSYQDARSRSNETIVAVVKGRGVVSGTVRQFEPAWRPSSLDLRTKRESTEDVRLARRSMGSEESSDTSSDEGDECAISMSKTFDEKLRILLDLENPFENKRSGTDAHSDDEKSSVRSEPQRKPVLSQEEVAQRRASDEPVGRVYKIVGMIPSSDSYGAPAATSNAGNVSRELNRTEKPDTELRSSNIVEINTSKYFTLTPSREDRASSSQPVSSVKRVSKHETPESSVGALRQRFESGPRRASDTPIRTSPQGNQGNRNKDRDSAPPSVTKKIGSLRTTTPVSLKEFNRKSASSPGRQSLEQRGSVQRPADSRTTTPRNIRLESSPAKHSSTASPRYSPGRNDAGDERNVRSRLNTSAAPGERSNRPPPYLDRGFVAPRVMNREYGAKSKLLSHKDSAKELLPSKTRIPPRDTAGSQTTHKLEKDAQHIAKLLEEMHSERHLHLSRQQSDISGQAQKAAAQRAAMRRRRRSLGDDNDADPTSPRSNSPQEGSRHASLEVPHPSYRARPNNREATFTRGPPRGNPVRSGFHTLAR